MSGRAPIASARRQLPNFDAVTIFAFAMLAVAATTTTLWEDLARLPSDGYAMARERLVFKGIAVNAIVRHLDSSSAGEPLLLADSLAKQSFVEQRITEAVYPHVVLTKATDSARVTLVEAPPTMTPEPGWTAAGTYRRNRLYLMSSTAQPSASGKAPSAETGGTGAASWLGLLDATCAGLGVGAIALLLLAKAGAGVQVAPVAVALLSGAFLLAVKCAAQSWLQIAWRGLFPGAGLLAVAAGAAYALSARGRLEAWSRRIRAAATDVESWMMVAVASVILFRQANLPVELWDGRSIWLFAAHRIHAQGMLALVDVGNPQTLWSHPDYPLLHSSWMSFAAGQAEAFDERMAAIGGVILLVAVMLILWRLARAEFGAWAGAAFAIAIVLSIDKLTAGAYADGLLAMLLAVETLAFGARRSQGTTAVAWIAAASASFTKNEGAVLAFAIAVVFVVLHPAWRARSWRERMLPFSVFAPTVVHGLWLSSLGVESVTGEVTLARSIADFFPRLAVALGAIPRLLGKDGYVHLRGAMWIGLFGLVSAVVGIEFNRSGSWRQMLSADATRIPLLSLLCAVVAFGFAFGSVSALTSDAKWLVGTALDRLLLHGAVLSVLAAMFALAPVETRPRPAVATTQAAVAAQPRKKTKRRARL